MKNTFTTLLIILSFSVFSQEADRFCYQFIGKDSIRFNLNKDKVPSSLSCAKYYRLAKVDSLEFKMAGCFEDFYTNDTLALKVCLKNNKPDGLFQEFYDNGQRKIQGYYSNGIKQGEWNYWYEDGVLFKKILYKNKEVLLMEHYNEKGEVKVKDGNGSYEDKNFLGYQTLKGFFRDGKKDGVWRIIDNRNNRLANREEFKNNKLIEGEDFPLVKSFKQKYYKHPFSIIDSIPDFIRNNALKNCNNCRKNLTAYTPFEFRSKLGDKELLTYLGKTYATLNRQGYAICSFVIETNREITDVKIQNSSAVEFDESSQLKKLISAAGVWNPEKITGEYVISSDGRRFLENKNQSIKSLITFIIQYTEKGYFFHPETILGAPITRN